jgi:hypothetical protein
MMWSIGGQSAETQQEALAVRTTTIDCEELASTPDPEAPPCEYCGGGLAHYPECPEMR